MTHNLTRGPSPSLKIQNRRHRQRSKSAMSTDGLPRPGVLVYPSSPCVTSSFRQHLIGDSDNHDIERRRRVVTMSYQDSDSINLGEKGEEEDENFKESDNW